MRLTLLLALLLASAGCEGESGSTVAPAPGPEAGSAALDVTAVFTRASLDLRGVRPELAELDRLAAEPAALPDMLDGLLDDARFADRVKDLFAPAFRTRIDAYPYVDVFTDEEEGEGGDGGYDPGAINTAIGEEPLDLIAWIAAHDRPFTDVVLAEHTVVRPVLLGYWPLEQVEGAHPALPGTVLARYTDRRPAAGVLSTNALWWRHTSTEENANRGRANALSDALLCESYLDRPIAFPRDIDLTDSESIRQAIRENPACAACHSTLDPLASHLWGFMYRAESFDAWAAYSPDQERDWMGSTRQAPGFFGKPTRNLRDLGLQIAADERFVMCAVRRVYQGLMARPLTVHDDGALATHREVFLASGLRLKALIRSVLDDPAWRGLAQRTDFGGTPDPAVYTLVTPAILASELEDLTGYRMRFAGRDVLGLDFGLRAVAGGSDRGAASSPSTGLVLVQRRLAEGAAAALVDGEAEGRLSGILGEDAFDAPPEPAALAQVVRAATTRPVTADGPEVAALQTLWGDIDDLGGPREAWVGTLTAILADPERLVR